MARVLVLNATYEPINVCTLRRAAVLLLKEKAELLEQREGGALHSEHMTMERPDVIRLVNYVRIPRAAANRSGRTSSRPAPPATARRATGFPGRSTCIRRTRRRRRLRRCSSRW